MPTASTRARTTVSRILAAGALSLLAVGIAGCGSDGLAKGDFESSITSHMREQGVEPQNVACPADPKAQFGVEVRCAFTVDDQPVDAVVTANKSDSGDVAYDIRTEAQPVATGRLEQDLRRVVSGQAGRKVDTAKCAHDLAPQIGQTTNCAVTGDGATTEFTLTVTSITRGLVGYSIQGT